MASGSFAVSGTPLGGSFGFASSAIAIPGTGTVLRIVNLGPCHIAVAVGASGVTVTQGAGLIIASGATEYLTVAAGQFLAGVACGGPGNSSTVNLASGTLTLA
jgi:hypothetical protein